MRQTTQAIRIVGKIQIDQVILNALLSTKRLKASKIILIRELLHYTYRMSSKTWLNRGHLISSENNRHMSSNNIKLLDNLITQIDFLLK